MHMSCEKNACLMNNGWQTCLAQLSAPAYVYFYLCFYISFMPTLCECGKIVSSIIEIINSSE